MWGRGLWLDSGTVALGRNRHDILWGTLCAVILHLSLLGISHGRRKETPFRGTGAGTVSV